MPLSTSANSYPPVMQEFLDHWASAQGALGRNFTLQGDYGSGELADDRTELQNLILTVTTLDLAQTQAAATRDQRKEGLRPRLAQFRGGVKSLLYGSAYPMALPTQPPMTTVASRYLRPFDETAALWATINADTTAPGFAPPLKLAGGYTQAQFVLELAALRAAYEAASTADQTAGLARDRRDAMLPGIRARLIQYRNVIVALFPPGSPIIQSLPAVTPPPGATPQAVDASGAWNAGVGKGILTWTPSDSAKLSYYAIRTAPGVNYRSKDETTIGHVAPGATTFETDAGLTAPGASAQFKIYVVTATGNERGSSTIEIMRPV